MIANRIASKGAARFARTAMLVIIDLAAPGLVNAQSIDVKAERTTRPPQIDGRDDDPAWRTAPVQRDFRTFTPREGEIPIFPTESRILYDDRMLYVLVRAFDPQPERITRRLARRDTFDPAADLVLLFIDSFHDRRNGYEYTVTSGGVKSDYLLSDDTGEDGAWDGIWEVATGIDTLGWIAEFAIPLQQLRFTDTRAPTFGVMIGRWVGRTGERASLPQYRRSMAGLVSQFGTLAGLHDLKHSGRFEVVPYMAGRARNVGGSAEIEIRPAVGADVKWLPRPNVTVDATMNPDFGQIEVDPAVLNLSGVEVFQSERRPFFKEGAGLLSFPLASDGLSELFYSRRIGRHPSLSGFAASDSPTETTILGAGRVTTRLSPTTSLVALTAVTAEARGAQRPSGLSRYVIEPRANYEVARLQRDFRNGRSGLGIMLTRVDRGGDSLSQALMPSVAQAAAVTTQHQSVDGVYQVQAWGAVSDVSGETPAISRLQLNTIHAYQRPDDGIAFDSSRTHLRGTAARLSGGKFGGGITRFSGSYRVIAPGFDVSEMGFLTKSGVQTASADIGLDFTRPGTVLGIPYRELTTTLQFQGEWSTQGLSYGRVFGLSSNLQLANLAHVTGSVGAQLPGSYCTVFCTRGGPALVDPPDVTATLDVTGDPRGALVPHVTAQWDRDDEGHSHGFGGQVDAAARVRSNLNVSLAAFASDARRAAFYYRLFGDQLSDTAHYTVARMTQQTRSLTGRFDYTVSPTLTAQWYGQAYVSRGIYADLREIADPRSPDWNRRFRSYGDSTIAASLGGIDFKQFRSNMVLRWEYRTGSALFVAWSQGRDNDGTTPGALGLWPGRDIRQLFAITPRNTVAVKFSYWLSR